jgi:hypothetical protein
VLGGSVPLSPTSAALRIMLVPRRAGFPTRRPRSLESVKFWLYQRESQMRSGDSRTFLFALPNPPGRAVALRGDGFRILALDPRVARP